MTARGTLVVNLMVQEDRLFAPGVGEVVTHMPMVLEKETGNAVFRAVTSDEYGTALHGVLSGIRAGTLRAAVLVDSSDMASQNMKHFRVWLGYIMSLLPRRADGHDHHRVLAWHARCDGHQLHLVASVCLVRSAVSSVLFSSALLVRTGGYKWRMRAALAYIVQEELEFHQGGDPDPQCREYARTALRKTVLRHFPEDQTPSPDSRAGRILADLQRECDDILNVLNGDWTIPRVAHRCRRRTDGRWCCSSRISHAG